MLGLMGGVAAAPAAAGGAPGGPAVRAAHPLHRLRPVEERAGRLVPRGAIPIAVPPQGRVALVRLDEPTPRQLPHGLPERRPAGAARALARLRCDHGDDHRRRRFRRGAAADTGEEPGRDRARLPAARRGGGARPPRHRVRAGHHVGRGLRLRQRPDTRLRPHRRDRPPVPRRRLLQPVRGAPRRARRPVPPRRPAPPPPARASGEGPGRAVGPATASAPTTVPAPSRIGAAAAASPISSSSTIVA